MPGVKGRTSKFTKRLHERRTKKENYQVLFHSKRNQVVQGVFGPFVLPLKFTEEEAEHLKSRGIAIPMDLWPNEWWDHSRMVADQEAGD